MGKRGHLLSLLALGVLATEPQYRYQDALLEKERYAAACPDYRTYSMYGQYV
jgi:hypothetical protein